MRRETCSLGFTSSYEEEGANKHIADNEENQTQGSRSQEHSSEGILRKGDG